MDKPVKLSSKLLEWRKGVYLHWCPACQESHWFTVGHKQQNGAQWTWDGNTVSPTFAPSMHIRLGPWEDEGVKHPQYTQCHYFLRNGIIQFLPDCAHAMKGQSVPLPDLPLKILEGHNLV